MLPRKKIDIGWTDLLFGMASCFRRRSTHRTHRRIHDLWSPADDTVVCLSVRSGLDLLLKALNLPRGSEILVSAVTIRDMVRIVEEHGLVPVPVDMDMSSLSVDPGSLRRALSERSRALLIAHLFGSRMSLGPLADFAHRHGLYLIEDCAQAYTGPMYAGDPESGACLFSFGPIKTNTALGGGILRIRDAAVLARVRDLHASYPVQSRRFFLKRLFKYAGIKLLLIRGWYTVFAAVCKLVKKDHDVIVSSFVRGFPGPDFFQRIRRRPCYPLLALLERRLKTFDVGSIDMRTEAAEIAIRRMSNVRRPGRHAASHSHWVFPIRSANPDALVRHLWDLGLDATRGASSLFVIDPPPGRPDLVPEAAGAAMRDIVYLPICPEIRDRDLERLARALTAFQGFAEDRNVRVPSTRHGVAPARTFFGTQR